MSAVLALAVAALGACGSSSHPRARARSGPTGAAGGQARLPGAGRPPVTLGTKNFTEEFILGQLYAQALQAKGYRIKLKNDIGSSEIIDRALSSGRIDGYPEYTGTILSAIAHQTRRPASAAEAYARAQSFETGRGMRLLDMTPAQDTNVVISKPAFARQHSLSSLSGLRRLGPSVTLGAPPEFKTRFAGLVGLRRDYGVTSIRFRALPIGGQYGALNSGQVQLANAFTTDGQLSQGGYTLLSDPRNIFGFQNITFVMRRKVLAREGAAYAQTINSVSAKLSTEALRVMNAAVTLDQQSPATVARQFLGANGLV